MVAKRSRPIGAVLERVVKNPFRERCEGVVNWRGAADFVDPRTLPVTRSQGGPTRPIGHLGPAAAQGA
jgi:hypothetical protein